jgi:hypothetical protein
MSMDRTKWTSCVASAITCANFYLWDHLKRTVYINNVIHGMCCGMPLKWLQWKHTICLMSFTRSGIFGAIGLIYTFTTMGDHFYIFCKPLVTNQMLFCSQFVTIYSQPLICLLFFLMLLLPYLTNKAVATIYLHDCFNVPIDVKPKAYI